MVAKARGNRRSKGQGGGKQSNGRRPESFPLGVYTQHSPGCSMYAHLLSFPPECTQETVFYWESRLLILCRALPVDQRKGLPTSSLEVVRVIGF